MAYSTITEIRNNEYILLLAVSADLTDAIVTHRIVMADNIVETDLAKIVTFPLAGTTPDYINLLSQYKATELCLIYLYTRKREGKENDDIQYWHDLYETLKDSIISGEIALGSDGTAIDAYTWQSRKDVEPALGEDQYANFKNLDELQDDRETR